MKVIIHVLQKLKMVLF